MNILIFLPKFLPKFENLIYIGKQFAISCTYTALKCLCLFNFPLNSDLLNEPLAVSKNMSMFRLQPQTQNVNIYRVYDDLSL